MSDTQLRVAITGGAGFIGRHFCRRLLEEGSLNSIIDLRPSPDARGEYRQVIGDVRDPRAVGEALRGANALLHLAAAHHDFGIERETFFSVNEEGARVLCAAMDEHGIRKACFFSSVAVYGSGAVNPDERTACRPESPYGESKLAGEKVFAEWAARGDGRSVLVIRPTVTFGPGHFANMYTLIRQISSRAFVRVGSGTNHKSLVYVDNLVEATLRLWSRPDAEPFDVFNMVDKPDHTSREITEAVYRGLGRRPPRFGVPLRAALIAALPFDAVISLTGANLPISSARVRKFADADTRFSAEKLGSAGIRPKVDLDEGIRRMVRWYVDEGAELPLDRSLPQAEVAPFGGVT